MTVGGGLRIPVVSGVSDSEKAKIHSEWDTLKEVVKILEMEVGFVPLKEPEFLCPVIQPGSLNDMSNVDYGLLYDKTLIWFGFISERVALEKAWVLQCTNEIKYIETSTKKRMFEAANSSGQKRPTGELLELAVETDERYIELRKLQQLHTQLRDLLQGRLDTIEANMKTISRQIEIRKLDREGSNTSSNLQNRAAEVRSGLRSQG